MSSSSAAPAIPAAQPWPKLGARLSIALAILYVLYALRMLWLDRLTTVHGDFWFMYQHLLVLPFPKNILLPENTHSMVIPKLFWLVNMRLFHGSETSHYLFTLLLLGIVAALFWRLARPENGGSPVEKALWTVSALLATFWLAKLQILMSAGFAVTCTLPVIGLLLSVLAVRRPGKPPESGPDWWLGLAGCALASLSFGTGLGVWPVMLLLVWGRHQRWREIAVVFAAMLLFAFFLLIVFPQWVPEKLQPHLLIHPVENLTHWLLLIGSPIGNTWTGLTGVREVSRPLTFASGIFGSLFAAGSLWRAWMQRASLRLPDWTGIALLVFGVCTSGLIALGRTTFFRSFPHEPFASRYLCWTSFLWLGALWLLPRWFAANSRKKEVCCLGLALLGPLVAWPAGQMMVDRNQNGRPDVEYTVASFVSGVPIQSFQLFGILPEDMISLDQTLRARNLCYYQRPAARSAGQALAAAFQVLPGSEPAVFAREKTYQPAFLSARGVRISGSVCGPVADAVLLSDQQQIIRGIGVFAGKWAPFSSFQRQHFAAFAPALPPGQHYRVWAVRGQQCQEIVPAVAQNGQP